MCLCLDSVPSFPCHPPPVLTRFLTDKGIDYLREYLNIPAEVVPNTLKKTNKPVGERPRLGGGPRGDRPPREGGFRDGYRREGGFGRGGGDRGDRGDKVRAGAGLGCAVSCTGIRHMLVCHLGLCGMSGGGGRVQSDSYLETPEKEAGMVPPAAGALAHACTAARCGQPPQSAACPKLYHVRGNGCPW